jgi:hypothetical protein
MRFLRSVLGVSLRDKVRSENVKKQLNTERMVEYKNTKRNGTIMWRGCLLNACHGKHTLIILLEDGTLGVQGDGDNSFSLKTGQRILEWEEDDLTILSLAQAIMCRMTR